jgi:hypothetical protein
VFLQTQRAEKPWELNDLRIQTSCLGEFHREESKNQVKWSFDKPKKIREMFWSGRRDLNSGPPAPKAGGLSFGSPSFSMFLLKTKGLENNLVVA